MAKALLGHVGGPDIRLLSDIRRLQKRVGELEALVLELQSENDALSAAMHGAELMNLDAEHAHEAALAGSRA